MFDGAIGEHAEREDRGGRRRARAPPRRASRFAFGRRLRRDVRSAGRRSTAATAGQPDRRHDRSRCAARGDGWRGIGCAGTVHGACVPAAPASCPIPPSRYPTDITRSALAGHQVGHQLLGGLHDHRPSLGSPSTGSRRTPWPVFSVMCGGSGGTSGSVLASSTTGRSAASASSQAARELIRIVDKDALEPEQLGVLRVAHVGQVLRRLEFRIAGLRAHLPGHLVQILGC